MLTAWLFSSVIGQSRDAAVSWNATLAAGILDPADTPSACNIERLRWSDGAMAKFEQEYRHKKPVILEGLANAHTNFDWSRPSVLKSWGDQVVDTFRFPNAAAAKRVEVSSHIKSMSADLMSEIKRERFPQPFYVFDKQRLGKAPWDEWLEVPPPLAQLELPENQLLEVFKELIIGPAHSGSHPHDHGEAFSVVTNRECRKKWLLDTTASADSLCSWNHDRLSNGMLVQKQAADGSALGTAQFIAERYSSWHTREGSYQCTLKQGEMIYVPEWVCHAVVNLNDCVSYALSLYDGVEEERRLNERDAAIKAAGLEIRFVCDEPATIVFIHPESGQPQDIGHTQPQPQPEAQAQAQAQAPQPVLHVSAMSAYPGHRFRLRTDSGGRESTTMAVVAGVQRQELDCRKRGGDAHQPPNKKREL